MKCVEKGKSLVGKDIIDPVDKITFENIGVYFIADIYIGVDIIKFFFVLCISNIAKGIVMKKFETGAHFAAYKISLGYVHKLL